jgi:hypothetical protein
MTDDSVRLCECGCGRAVRKRFVKGHHAHQTGPPHLEDPATGCWIWQYRRDIRGYGNLTVKGKRVLAHRWYYEQEVGPIPEGLGLDHACRNKACVNPAHLRPATHSENAQNREPWPGRGTYFAARRGRWVAVAQLNGKRHFLGYYDTQEQASAVSAAFRAEHMPFSQDANA